MKEAFVLFWFCLIIAFIMSLLGMSLSMVYVLRTAFLRYNQYIKTIPPVM